MAKKSSNPSVSYAPTHRIIVMHGAERFLMEEHTRRFVEALGEKFGGVEQFNFDGDTAQPAAVLDELRSYGLMQKHKVVILDNAAAFLAGGKGQVESDDDDDEESGSGEASGEKKGPSIARRLMEKYAEQPVDDATLIMRANGWRPGNIDKFITKSGGAIIACEALEDDKAAGWCIKRVEKRMGTTINADAAALLVQRVGPELLHLDMELSKLASMAGPGKPITRELVAEAIELSREEKAWQIQDAIVTQQPATMLRKLTELLQVSRHDVVPLSWAVIDLLRKIHMSAQMLRQGVPAGSVMGKARLWGESGHAILALARKIEPAVFAQLLQKAIDTDRAAKTGLGEPVRSLEALLVTIADRLES